MARVAVRITAATGSGVTLVPRVMKMLDVVALGAFGAHPGVVEFGVEIVDVVVAQNLWPIPRQLGRRPYPHVVVGELSGRHAPAPLDRSSSQQTAVVV